MDLLPAIDLRGGKCVRLYQGDYGRETVYSKEPAEVAARWAALGATWIHVVDLDGARAGAPANLDVVREIVSSVSVPVQCGGGVRTVETARDVLDLGVARVMVGTAAVDTPGLVAAMCDRLGPEAVVVTVDARDGYVAVKGWTESSRVPVSALVARMAEAGVRRVMYTDIARDGTLTGPNFTAVEDLVGRTDLRVLAAGGITSVDDLVRLAGLGVEGAIVGKALYTGDVDLSEALEALRRVSE